MSETMKASRYNVLVPLEGAFSDALIAFNARTGALALVDGVAREMLEQTAPVEASPATAAELTESGFLVDAAADELAAVKAQYRRAQQDPSLLALCIAPTYACNLACPYCYEAGRNASAKAMPPDVQDRIVAFAKDEHAEAPYERLEVQWYGGEPMLHPEVIERISSQLLEFCAEHDIALSANIVSNATRITADDAAMLRRSHVFGALVTIDGTEELHNERRPARDGSNSYEAAIAGIGHLLDADVNVTVMMNTDRVNDGALDELNADLAARLGVQATRVKLNDYYGTFGTGDFCEPRFSLMDHREFTREQCERFCAEGRSPREFAALMQPISLFCRGQHERYYCIDALGDVYKCDGRMARTDHVAFSLDDLDEGEGAPQGLAPSYPFDDHACVSCALLPLCKGNCEWERKCCSDHPCHPLKYTMDGYLRGWVRSFGEVEPDPETGIVVLWPGSAR